MVQTGASLTNTSNEVSLDDGQFIKKFNSQDYIFELTFDNKSGQKFTIQPQAVIQLVIEDDLLFWPIRGYLIYDNRLEMIERSLDPDGLKGILPQSQINKLMEPAYKYRNDGRDELHIYIKPKLKDGESFDADEDLWTIDLTFIIYDSEDLPVANSLIKQKKLYFWDKKYETLLEKTNFNWSTATTSREDAPTYPSQATDDERKMLTGEAIKSLLTDIGLSENIDEKNWDVGKEKVFYTKPYTYSAFDALNSLLDSHIASVNDDICLFHFDRRINKWYLRPVSKFFELAGKDTPGELQHNHMFFEDISNGDGEKKTSTEAVGPLRAPLINETNFGKDFKGSEATFFNRIQTYSFVDMAGIDNAMELVTRPIYSYDFQLKQFNTDVVENKIDKVRDHFKKYWVEKVMSDGGVHPLFTLNLTKTNQENLKPLFSPFGLSNDDRLKRSMCGKGKTLLASLFLNSCLNLRLLGSINRIAGSFVGIDRLVSYDSDDLDNKMCGQWFVTKVRHIFHFSAYVTDLTATKIHSYKTQNIEENIN